MANILRLITWLPVGGIERKLLAILPKIQVAGKRRVRVCCLRERGPLADELEREGVPVDVIPFRKRWDWAALKRLRALMIEHNIHIVHSHMYRSNVPATVAAHFARVPIVISQVHNVDTWETRRQRWVDRMLMGWRDTVVAVSEAVRRDIHAQMGVPEDKTRVIYNGVDLEHFASSDGEARKRLRAEWELPPGAVVALMLARLHSQKNPLGLLDAFDRIADQAPLLHLVYVGDGPAREKLEAEVRRRNLAERVRLLGLREDIPEALAACDFTVLPSFKEGFSNTILESMAAGKAVLCTDVGGAAEVVVSGKSGLIVPPGDVEALAQGLQRLGRDSALRKVFGDAARARVKRFSLDRMAQDTMGLYDELLRRKGIIENGESAQ